MKIKYWNSKYVLPIIIGVLAFLFVPFEALDSYRYYQQVNLISTNISTIEFIKIYFFRSFDFIYYLLQYICILLNIPVQTITGISVALLYIQSFKSIDIIRKKHGIKLKLIDAFFLHLFVLTSVSYIAVWSITRNQIGIMFVAYGINYLLRNKNIVAIVFFLLSMFTHTGLIFYLLIFFTGYYLLFIDSKKNIRIFAISGLILGYTASMFIGNVFRIISDLFFLPTEYDYKKYLEDSITTNVFQFNLGWGDKSMFITTAVVVLFFLQNLKSFNPILKGTIFIFIWLCISLGFSQMHTQRTLLFLIPMQGILGTYFLIENRKSIILYLYRLLIIVSTLTFTWNIWAYRDNWIFKVPY